MSTDRVVRSSVDRVLALDAKAAAASLCLAYTSFIDLVRRGEISYVIVGGGAHREHRRFLLADLRAWAMRNRVPAKWEVPDAPDERER